MNGFRGLFKNIGSDNGEEVTTAPPLPPPPPVESDGSMSSSFFSNTSSFFQSVQAKKDNLVSNISSSIGLGHKQPVFKRKENSDDSSASEYGDGGDCPNYEDCEEILKKSQSFDSIESMNEDEYAECHNKVVEIYTKATSANGYSIGDQDLKILNEILERHTGRSKFTKYFKERLENENDSLDGRVFDNICKLWRACLNKCDEADDTYPAVILMQLTYTINRVNSNNSLGEKEFLYMRLKDLSIWKSLAFWNAAFFVVMHKEKAKLAKTHSDENIKSTQDKLKADKKRHEEIAYSQLNKFVWFMHIMGIERENCLDFLRRQGDSVSLPKEKRRIIESNIKKSFEDPNKR